LRKVYERGKILSLISISPIQYILFNFLSLSLHFSPFKLLLLHCTIKINILFSITETKDKNGPMSFSLASFARY
jgi:hypothetical protein